jgi:hypothetical protein
LDGKATNEICGDNENDASNEIVQDVMSPPPIPKKQGRPRKNETVVTQDNKQDELPKVGATVFATNNAGGQQVVTHASKQDDTPTAATVIATNNAGEQQGGSNGDDDKNPEEGNNEDNDGIVDSHAIDQQNNIETSLRKHCRHSEAEIVKTVDGFEPDVKYDDRKWKLPHYIRRIMFPKKEKKKKTKKSDSNSLELIGNDLIAF